MREKEREIGEILRRKGLKLAIAESATGGKICDLITDIPGSSDYFLGGIVAYDPEIKVRILGVRRETIDEFTVVSREVAAEMAEGVRRLLGAEVGVGTTGIAGPTGEMPGKPVGLICIAVATPKGVRAEEFRFSGGRMENKSSFAEAALNLLLEELRKL